MKKLLTTIILIVCISCENESEVNKSNYLLKPDKYDIFSVIYSLNDNSYLVRNFYSTSETSTNYATGYLIVKDNYSYEIEIEFIIDDLDNNISISKSLTDSGSIKVISETYHKTGGGWYGLGRYITGNFLMQSSIYSTYQGSYNNDPYFIITISLFPVDEGTLVLKFN